MKLILSILFIVLIIVSGCVSTTNGSTYAEGKCIELCQQEKAKGTDLSYGPCLSNEIAEDWVCDVAHSPRQDVDNNPQNQCPAFGNSANHFVEVDPDCNLIRTY